MSVLPVWNLRRKEKWFCSRKKETLPKLSFNSNNCKIISVNGKKSLSVPKFSLLLHPLNAQMAELVDALVSNTSGFTSMPVRSRLWVQFKSSISWFSTIELFCFLLSHHICTTCKTFYHIALSCNNHIYRYLYLFSAIYSTKSNKISSYISPKKQLLLQSSIFH